MGVERRRTGFRLPWSADGEESDETQAATTDAAGEASSSDAAPAPATAEASEPEPMTATGSAPAADAATPEAPGADEPTAVAASTDEPMTAVEATASSAAAPATDGESDDFLKSLVGAMRTVAETSRETSLAELRTAIDERIETLRTQAAERETDIRRQADTDLEAVGEWERTDIDRVKAEAETKRSDRRTQLEQQLAAHRTASEQAVESARSRLAQHESELAAFFAQLGEITDPAAFVAAAKRMPRAPELESAGAESPAAEPPASGGAVDPRLAALGVTPTSEDSAAETPAAPAEDSAAPSAETATDAAVATNGASPGPDAQLAERLAQLDQRLAAQPATPAATTPAAGGETSTAIVVKGLGSFGAITSFKQSLERVEGVRGVTLSLGPTGEFVYRASHAAEFDLVAAIQGLEGPTASIENTDGTLVVTLSRAR
jgi:hypothetical protein